jgi:tRNA wybutosine-synthesizing protein 2
LVKGGGGENPPFAVEIDREQTEVVRKELTAFGLVDDSRRIIEKGTDPGKVEIPIKAAPPAIRKIYNVVVQSSPVSRHRQVIPADDIVRSADIPGPLKKYLPRKWDRVGDVLFLKIPPEIDSLAKSVARTYAEQLHAKAIFRDLGVEGEYRTPKVELLYGSPDDTETIHIENGIKFRLDTAKIMFSSGNIDERIYMSKLPADGETVVDMFAGIGYFSIPMAVYSRPLRIIACEKNPVSYHYLVSNIELNDVGDTVEPVCTDSLDAPENVADRVVMGLLPTAESYVQKAIKVINRENGGMIHFHTNAKEDEVPGKIFSRVKDIGANAAAELRLASHRWIKSYAPLIWHVVLDIEVFFK